MPRSSCFAASPQRPGRTGPLRLAEPPGPAGRRLTPPLPALRGAPRLAYPPDASGPALSLLRLRHAGRVPAGPAGGSVCRPLPVPRARRGRARDVPQEWRQPGARRQLLSYGPAPVPSRKIRSRLSRRWRRPERPSSPRHRRAASSPPAPPPLSPVSSPTRWSHHLRASSSPDNSSRPSRPTTSSSVPRVRILAAARGPQTREQRHGGTSAIRPSRDPHPRPHRRTGRRPGQARSTRPSRRLGRHPAPRRSRRAHAVDLRLRRGRVYL